ncbi:hypothetical protein C8A03DRAFT_31442 [Achaetomium macrosporum]|uniref:Short-chain dehydrogenase/reductase n=1 Tax=Achaetomium macrosporum TaxID=79813 RepID=A0AAN7CEP3_9PEZI|nr:hypothetical protein C8A03DRAFT_31442 [Achaetomium macrosporum]
MVTLQDIRRHNNGLRSRARGLVAVFTGSTRGIGLATLRELLSHLVEPVIYIVGRSKAKFADEAQTLQSLNSGARIHFIEADVALLREIDRVCERVLTTETKLDLLFMSQAFIPLSGPEYTKEGIDTCMSLCHYGRVRLVYKLLPLLRMSVSPRVVSVLAGGSEKRLLVDDMGLRLPSNYSMMSAANHMACLQTLALAHLAGNNPEICFIHGHPGLVRTDIVSNAFSTPAQGFVDAITRFFGSWFIAPIFNFLAMSEQESGERHTFLVTSTDYMSPAAFKAKGRSPQQQVEIMDGLYLVNSHGEVKADWGLLEKWMNDGTVEKAWEHTLHVFDSVLP